MAKDRNRIVGERLDGWALPKDVRDVINATEYRLLAELFGDIGTSERLVEFVRAEWACDDYDKYDWWELHEWKY